jgi:hypothetical protein
MITAFIDMVGLLMIIPLLPFYVKTLGQDANGFMHLGPFALKAGTVVGMLVSSFALAQLLTAVAPRSSWASRDPRSRT